MLLFNRYSNNEYNDNMKDDFDSLNQGLQVITEKNNKIYELENNINHEKDNIIEGSTTSSESAEMTQKINIIKTRYENNRKEYNNMLTEYTNSYKNFLHDFSGNIKKILDCKAKCQADYYIINDSDSVDDKKKKQKIKDACKAGCHFKNPQLRTCVDTYKPLTGKESCSQIEKKCEEIGNGKNDSAARSAKSDLTQLLGEDNISAYDGCCAEGCGLIKKFKPQYTLSDNTEIYSCNDIVDDEQRNACTDAKASIKTSINKDAYSRLTKKNNDLIALANDILKNVQDLKELNVNIVSSKSEQMHEFKNKTLDYEKLLKLIKKEQDVQKKNTLDKRVNDYYLLSKSTNMRFYTWFILALGFGISALYKIKGLK